MTRKPAYWLASIASRMSAEAVNALDPALLATEPDVPWREVVGARHWLAHRYFAVAIEMIEQTVREDLVGIGETRRGGDRADELWMSPGGGGAAAHPQFASVRRGWGSDSRVEPFRQALPASLAEAVRLLQVRL